MRSRQHILATLPLLAAAMAFADGVVLRDGAEPPPGTIVAVTIEGVRLDGLAQAGSGASTVAERRQASTLPTPRTIAWDRVLRVEGDWGDDAAPFGALAERAWRARIRLARGDAVGAEPLLEELAEALAGRSGPTAAGVAIGLVRCRVERGGPIGAIPALVEFHRAGGVRAGGEDLSVWWLGAPGLTPTSPLVDPITELCPDVPPIFVRLPGVQTLARTDLIGPVDATTEDGAADPRWRVLARLYLGAAGFESGKSVPLPVRPGDEDRPLAWMWDIVASRVGEPEVRTQARTRLRTGLSQQTALWQEAWSRAAIGRSLLLEADAEQRWLGVAELLNLPARLGGEAPYVGGIAMAEAAVALASMGDPRGALRVKEDLLRRYPQHPALEWDPLVRVTGQAPAVSGRTTPDPQTTGPSSVPPSPSPSPAPSTPNPSPTGGIP